GGKEAGEGRSSEQAARESGPTDQLRASEVVVTEQPGLSIEPSSPSRRNGGDGAEKEGSPGFGGGEAVRESGLATSDSIARETNRERRRKRRLISRSAAEERRKSARKKRRRDFGARAERIITRTNLEVGFNGERGNERRGICDRKGNFQGRPGDDY
ncbi:hypothetical protein KFL_017770010, partial [Klebsormidium nitens]